MKTTRSDLKLLTTIQDALYELTPEVRSTIPQDAINDPDQLDALINELEVECKLTALPLPGPVDKVRMIKAVRAQTGAGLRWSKAACDAVEFLSADAAIRWLKKNKDYLTHPDQNPPLRYQL